MGEPWMTQLGDQASIDGVVFRYAVGVTPDRSGLRCFINRVHATVLARFIEGLCIVQLFL